MIKNIGTEEQVRLWDGLQSYWKLDESGTTAYDSIGCINLTKTTITSVAGKNNNCSDFTAAGSRIAALNTANFNFERTNSWTFSFWYKYGGTSGRILSKNDGTTGQGYSIYFYAPSYDLGISVYGTNGTNAMAFKVFPIEMLDSNWHLLTWTYAGTSLISGNKFYVDGVEKTKTDQFNTLNASIQTNKYFQLGNIDGYDQCFQGNLDEVGIWNRVLSPTEVSMLYSAGNGKFYGVKALAQSINQIDGLTSYWKLNESEGTSVADAKSTVTGTASAASWVSGKNGNGFSTISSRWIGFGTTYLRTAYQPYSVSMWYRITSLSNGYAVLISNCNVDLLTGWIDCYINSTSRNLWWTIFYNNSYRVNCLLTAQLPNDTNWHHLILNYDGDPTSNSSMKVYIDNVDKSSNTITNWNGYSGNLGSTLMIGKRGQFTYDPVEVDEVGLFSQILSSNDRSTIYNSGTGLFY